MSSKTKENFMCLRQDITKYPSAWKIIWTVIKAKILGRNHIYYLRLIMPKRRKYLKEYVPLWT